jgi:hypothetical protein
MNKVHCPKCGALVWKYRTCACGFSPAQGGIRNHWWRNNGHIHQYIDEIVGGNKNEEKIKERRKRNNIFPLPKGRGI